MRHMPFGGGMPWMMHFGSMLLLALGIALFVIWWVKRKKGFTHHAGQHHAWQPGPPGQPGQPGPPFPPHPGNAVQILDERLARGEIEVDDYLSRRAALLGDRPNGTEFSYGGQPPESPQPRRPEPGEGGGETV